MARKMNMGLMLGAAAGGLGLLFLLGGKKKVSAPKDSGKDVNAMSYDELVQHTLSAIASPERAAWDRNLLDQAVNSGLNLSTAGADEIQAAMDHEAKLMGDQIVRAAKDAAYASTEDFSQFSSMTRPPQGTIDRAVAYVKAKDPAVTVLPGESFSVLHAAGQLPSGTILVFVSNNVTRDIQSGGGRGFVLMSGAEVMKRMTVAAGAATAGAAGYGGGSGVGDYVQMPYSGMGFGALYAEKGGSGATGLGF